MSSLAGSIGDGAGDRAARVRRQRAAERDNSNATASESVRFMACAPLSSL